MNVVVVSALQDEIWMPKVLMCLAVRSQIGGKYSCPASIRNAMLPVFGCNFIARLTLVARETHDEGIFGQSGSVVHFWISRDRCAKAARARQYKFGVRFYRIVEAEKESTGATHGTGPSLSFRRNDSAKAAQICRKRTTTTVAASYFSPSCS